MQMVFGDEPQDFLREGGSHQGSDWEEMGTYHKDQEIHANNSLPYLATTSRSAPPSTCLTPPADMPSSASARPTAPSSSASPTP